LRNRIGLWVACLLLVPPAANLGISHFFTNAVAYQDPEFSAAPACVPETREAPGLRVIAWGCGRPVIFYVPGLGAQASDRKDLTLEALFAGLVDAGYGVVVGDIGFNTWGNPASVEALHQLVQQYNGGQAPRLIGMSMSGAHILNYGKKYPVHSAVGLIPVTKWTREVMIRSGKQPPLPTSVSYRYTIWHATDDTIVGYPEIQGAEVRWIKGDHVIGLDWPAPEIAEALQ
jgi:pimeloyl-ACP methyl ester carboxylesterase